MNGFRNSLINILGGFDALSDMIHDFIEEYQSEPQSLDLMFAIVQAKQAADGAASLLRSHLRGS